MGKQESLAYILAIISLILGTIGSAYACIFGSKECIELVSNIIMQIYLLPIWGARRLKWVEKELENADCCCDDKKPIFKKVLYVLNTTSFKNLTDTELKDAIVMVKTFPKDYFAPNTISYFVLRVDQDDNWKAWKLVERMVERCKSDADVNLSIVFRALCHVEKLINNHQFEDWTLASMTQILIYLRSQLRDRKKFSSQLCKEAFKKILNVDRRRYEMEDPCILNPNV